MIPGAVWRYGAAFVLGAVIAATAQGWRYGTKIAKAESAISTERTEAMKYILAEQQASASRIAEADQKHTGELIDAKGKIADLERRVANGSSGLRVAAKCPASNVLPKASAASGVGGEANEEPELDESARPHYFSLFKGIRELEAALKICVESR